MMPTPILAGDCADFYLDTAIGLYKKGKKGRFLVDDVALLLLDDKSLKIVMLFSDFALFQQDPVSRQFYVLFQDVVPSTFPTFTNLLPGMPTFFPVYPDELLAPAYNQLQLYTPGSAAPYLTLAFQNPILSSHGEGLAWYAAMTHPNVPVRTGDDPTVTGNVWHLLKYQLTGYVNPYDNPMTTKMTLSDGGTGNLWEYDFNAPNVVCAHQVEVAGINYHRIKDTNATGDVVERVFAAIQDGSSYSGALFEVLESSNALGLNLLDLPALPSGSRGTYTYPGGSSYTEHIDWTVDVFTSERAQHYYIVKFCADNSIGYYGQDFIHVNDLCIFPGTSLTVEKRLKSDLSLVQTFNLTPTAVDQVLQGLSVHEQNANVVNAGYLMLGMGWSSDRSTLISPNLLTRFAPFGFGGVLVDESGNEFPVLVGISCTQDIFSTSDSNRAAYIAGTLSAVSFAGYSGSQANILQQTVALWLGGSGIGYSWPGVDAVGLPGVGATSQCSSGIADSDTMMLQLQPLSDGTQQSIVTVNLQGGVPTVTLQRQQSTSQGFYMYDI